MTNPKQPEPPPSDCSNGFFKATRHSDAEELLAANPLALVLAYVIARRAWWRGGFSQHGLSAGEAMLGDHRRCGMSEQQYRTAKQLLRKGGFATFKTTNKGTIGKLIDTRLFSVVNGQANGQSNRQATDSQRTGNGQPTTNEEVKKGKNEKKERKEGDVSPSIRFQKPTLEEVKAAAAEKGLPEEEAEKFHNHYEANGWLVGRSPMKSWPHALNNWKIGWKERQGESPRNPTPRTNHQPAKHTYTGPIPLG